MYKASAVLLLGLIGGIAAQCTPSITTASGTQAPLGQICSGDLIFNDDFDKFDLSKWKHEITMSGGDGNWEFQIYNHNRSTSWAENGNLVIRPRLTIDQYGLDFLEYGTINLLGGSPAYACTDPSFFGCERTGNGVDIINPIQSASLRTLESFSFKYGRVEIRAKMPLGDWLWPALWMMPRHSAYGNWPTSGEIDIAEVRGNARLLTPDGGNVGIQQTGSTLHWGPYWPVNSFMKTRFDKNLNVGLNEDFHRYQLEWTDSHIKFSLDDEDVGYVAPPAGGFWELGDFSQIANAENPWRNGGFMAPFDEEFYLKINLAVGGTGGYFPDVWVNDPPKPWSDNSLHAFLDFWNGRNQWEPTWKMYENNGDSSSLKVDYVKIWAL